MINYLANYFARNESKLEFDPDHYRALYPDMRDLSDRALRRHFLKHGLAEGRAGSRYALRENFVTLIDPCFPTLEIGPFTRPTVRGPKVRYFDLLDTQALLAPAQSVGYLISNPPEIDYVSADGDLSIVDEVFQAIVSSHVIEHQPDLIGHLLEVERLLSKGGKYFLIVPDHRYCFDHFIEQTHLNEVLAAHSERRTRHTLQSVVNHRARTTHNDAWRHWKGDHADPGYEEGIEARTRAAEIEYSSTEGRYISVHAWQFTPLSFYEILQSLNKKGIIQLSPQAVFNTPLALDEFCAVLALD